MKMKAIMLRVVSSQIGYFLKKLEARNKEQECGSGFLRFLKGFKDCTLVDATSKELTVAFFFTEITPYQLT